MSQSVKLGSYLRITSQLAQRIGIGSASFPEFIKFLVVGLLNTIVGMGLMYFLKNELEWPFWYATFAGNTAGAAVSFLMNRIYTFKSSVPIHVGAARFIIVVMACYFLSFSISRLITRTMDAITAGPFFIGADNTAILLGSIIYTLTNYIGQKFLVFKGSTQSSL
ncbi:MULTISPECIES: GtrA family protein [unclassified Bacillus (in: firmicutes)]|uniref:GtrA family protein n=1 Tax=unclassified Bacillus (in: firmicutes) TaxID=185979 RepID=UPI001BE79FD7|nr:MULTISPECIES: GtrA family protein [unclassified Bacillus (in: firmicutes)]MBT2638235.1 GtrA family protein [Bacillus sp. ISL-39]MBT2662643.1 GtrA family protein [Bacillus sp. ISL-45]